MNVEKFRLEYTTDQKYCDKTITIRSIRVEYSLEKVIAFLKVFTKKDNLKILFFKKIFEIDCTEHLNIILKDLQK